jgi:hypothetical protein
MTYTIRYDFDGVAKEVRGLVPDRAKALCQELAAIGIATTAIFPDGQAPERR